mmetsp:Transcript_271/g.920  ORF Transcript_271/g.920 Transcript_271/m.920 type:complete len:223 (+) Transcript_271:997-1665(+)
MRKLALQLLILFHLLLIGRHDALQILHHRQQLVLFLLGFLFLVLEIPTIALNHRLLRSEPFTFCLQCLLIRCERCLFCAEIILQRVSLFLELLLLLVELFALLHESVQFPNLLCHFLTLCTEVFKILADHFTFLIESLFTLIEAIPLLVNKFLSIIQKGNPLAMLFLMLSNQLLPLEFLLGKRFQITFEHLLCLLELLFPSLNVHLQLFKVQIVLNLGLFNL